MKKPLLLPVIFIFLVTFTTNLYAEIGATNIAKWKDNKSGAFSMGFDDAVASHVDYCIPAFVKRGLTGSFWVNPATTRYGYGIDTWEGPLGQNVIELCPHSMNHSGSLFMEQAIYEVEECLDIVWSLNPPGQSKLVLFLGGGGAVYPQGFRQEMRSRFPTLVSGRGGGGRYRGEGLIAFAKGAIDGGVWNAIATHGTGPYAEYLSFDASEFEALLDYLASVKDKLWVGTCGDVHKYNKERASAKVSVIEAQKDRVRLRLTSDENPELYDYPLTLISEVPKDWKYCKVTQSNRMRRGFGMSQSSGIRQGSRISIYKVEEGKVMYEAFPGRGEIILVSSKMDVTPPTAPVVRDGLDGDMDGTYFTDRLSASWDECNDPETGIASYWYKIGTTPGGSEVIDWINNGLETSVTVTRTSLSLIRGEKYYFTVKAVNGVGLSSEGKSDGQEVQKTSDYIIFEDDFESGKVDKWARITQSGGNTVKISENEALEGKYCAELNVNGKKPVSLAAYELKRMDDGFISFNFKLSPDFKIPENGRIRLMYTMLGSGGINVANIYISTSDETGPYLYASFTDNTRRSFSLAEVRKYPYDRVLITPGKWYRIDFRNKIDPRRGGAELWVNGERKGTVMYRFTERRSIGYVELGATAINSSGISGKLYLDNVVISDSRLK